MGVPISKLPPDVQAKLLARGEVSADELPVFQRQQQQGQAQARVSLITVTPWVKRMLMYMLWWLIGFTCGLLTHS